MHVDFMTQQFPQDCQPDSRVVAHVRIGPAHLCRVMNGIGSMNIRRGRVGSKGNKNVKDFNLSTNYKDIYMSGSFGKIEGG